MWWECTVVVATFAPVSAEHSSPSPSSLSQLQMLGYDISWAAFNIIEVMSASKFTFKVRT